MSVETTVRAMTRAEKVAYLKAHGWHRISWRGSQTWQPPGDPAGFYTLAAAIRTALARRTA